MTRAVEVRAIAREHCCQPRDFFRWINDRHAIYHRRFIEKRSKPWTLDPIMQKYKFTNVFRQLDRGTIWLTEHFIRPHYDDRDQSLLLFNIVLYRMFNWWETGEFLGYLTQWNEARVRRALERRRAEGHQVFTGAHILRSDVGMPKITSHCRVLTRFWKDRQRLVEQIRKERTLQAAFELFNTYHCIGGFLAYEFVTDLRWTHLLEQAPDKMSWANAGPGAYRGLLRMFPDMERKNAVGTMRDLLSESQKRGVLQSHVPALEMRDIEHSLCEFDKYMRVKNGEGRPRSTYPGLPARQPNLLRKE